MAKKFQIVMNTGKYSIDTWSSCWYCDKKIKKNIRYIKYGGNSIYHLVCFKKQGERLLKLWELFAKNIQEHLNKLAPHQKDMICESLEGYGQKKSEN
jgi:hypothetical protein